MASNAARRTWVVDELVDPETGEAFGYDREHAGAILQDLEAVLFTVGGQVAIAADRVQVGELGGSPIASSRRLIIEWQAYSPMEKRRQEAPAPEVDVERVLPDGRVEVEESEEA